MRIYDDELDLYGPNGKLLEGDIPLEAISPLKNSAIQNMIYDIKRSAAVNLAGIEKGLKTAAMGGKSVFIPGRELDLPIVENADMIGEKIRKILQVSEDDDTTVNLINGGQQLLVQLPFERLNVAADYSVATLQTAAATIQAIIDSFDINMFDASTIKTSVMGAYPRTVDLSGAQISALLGPPVLLEGLGYGLRNIMANHVVAITNKQTLNAAALSSIMEQTAMFETGDATGAFERMHLLTLAYQGLNADNLVFDIVKENAKGTVGTVIQSLVGRAIEDNVIKVAKKMPSGYNMYEPVDWALWNAYAAAGLLAAVIVNIGAARAAQAVASTVLYYNDMLEYETGLPGVDYGRTEGVGVGFSFFSHSIYGGGGPGTFHGNHVVTRHAKGTAIPCASAAMCLDAGTQMFSVKRTSALIGTVYGTIDNLRNPIPNVANVAGEIKEKL